MANFSKYMAPPGVVAIPGKTLYYMADLSMPRLKDPRAAYLNSGEPDRLKTANENAGQSQARESSQIVLLREQKPGYNRIFKPFGNIGNGAAQHRFPIRPDFVPLPKRSNPFTRVLANPYAPYGS